MDFEQDGGLGPHGGFVDAHPEVCPVRRDPGPRTTEPPHRAGTASVEAREDASGRDAPFRLDVFRLGEGEWTEGWDLKPAPARRDWMDALPYAYQCLPLVMANQWGWLIHAPADIRVTWDGHRGLEGLRVDAPPAFRNVVKSQFGDGIVTFTPPWLFRTPPGWDLLLKGPSNRWKANAAALEGVIETWWLSYTFTLNWKLIEPGTIRFERGEPIGQLVPIPHETFRAATAVEAPIESRPEVYVEMTRWQVERTWRSSLPVTTHHRYRKADEIEGHLHKVPVPKVTRPDE